MFDRNSLSSLICRNATVLKVTTTIFENITKGNLPAKKRVIFEKLPQLSVRKRNHKYHMKTKTSMKVRKNPASTKA